MVHLWDVMTGEHKEAFTGHTEGVQTLALSPDGGTIASGSRDHTIRFWDVTTGEQKEILIVQGEIIWDLTFSPDGLTLASGGDDGPIRLWSAVTGEQKGTLTGHEDDVLSLAFSPDGRTLASGGGRWDYTLRLWDVGTGVSKEILTGHTWTVNSLAFHPDGEILASGSGDGTVLLWELPLPTVFGDVNRDGVVNLQDLMHVSLNFGRIGQNDADLNGDGVVNILDLVTVAGAIGEAAAAPSAQPRAFGSLTAAEVRGWLTQAQDLDFMDLRLRRGIFFLEQLLAALTPKETGLLPNYPNPFNPETWIPYHLAYASDVILTIYDTKGGLVRRLDLGHQQAGSYTAQNRAAYWDGCNKNGELVASGIYFYTLTAADFTATRKMSIHK